jgi:tetratricopeptide (TPR) repeat protein
VGRSLDRLARAYELASQLDRAIETSRQAASTLSAAYRRDPANKEHLKAAGLAFLRLGSLCRARAAGRKGDLALADWRSAQTAFERAAAMLNELDSSMNLTEEDQQRIGSMTAAIEDCRRRLLRGSP